MHVAIVSTYLPRACGLATFSSDLRAALSRADGVDQVDVVAVVDSTHNATPSTSQLDEVIFTIERNDRAQYVRAARLLGQRGVDIVLIEHEFGIFGGSDGDHVLSLVSELSMPSVVTLHTVLSRPSPGQTRVLDQICRWASGVMVFTETAQRMLTASGVVESTKVHVVPHGAPTVLAEVAGWSPRSGLPLPISSPGASELGVARLVADLAGRFVVSTFGLLSESKGLDTAIDALGTIVKRHPDVVLLIAGRTHPEVARRDGERYRQSLQSRAAELGLREHVRFEDRFLAVEELAHLLAVTDLYVTPYRSREQIVSGSLTFALAAGRPVVSTPYYYAEDLLSGGAGRLVPFGDPAALAEAVCDLVEHPEELAKARVQARRVGKALSWPAVGQATAEVLTVARRAGLRQEEQLVTEQVLPPVRTDHLLAMIDDVGVVQHARGCVPDLGTGYCVDDVARMVQVADELWQRDEEERWRATEQRGLSFLWHAAGSGTGRGMHNFMSYSRAWLDEPGMGDHVGRALWALGELLARDRPPALAEPVRLLADRLGRDLDASSPTLRTAAYAALGMARPDPGRLGPDWSARLDRFAAQLVGAHRAHSQPGWDWFEDRLTYDNARLSQALMVAGHRLGQPETVRLGLKTLAWYGDQCQLETGLRLPGNGWRHRREAHPGEGDEQPIDAAALVEAELDALNITGDPAHGRRARWAFEWFLGRNRLGIPLYDEATGGCCDGLEADRVNINQGAESTLAFHRARLLLAGTAPAGVVGVDPGTLGTLRKATSVLDRRGRLLPAK